MQRESRCRVYAGDTDFTGLVYTPRVVEFAIRAIEDFRREVGVTHEYVTDCGLRMPTVHLNVDYLAPLRLDDELSIEIETDLGTSSITYEVTGRKDGEAAFRLELVSVAVDAETFESVAIPDEIGARLESA